jgi:hypothetical protein
MHWSQFPGLWFWNPGGKFYIFVSGIGGDLAYLSVLGLAWRKLNCHSKGCWRIGTHEYEMDGVVHRLCRHCHPGLTGKRFTRLEFQRHHERGSA